MRDRAGIWLFLPDQDMQQGGFTRAVQPDQPDPVASVDAEGDVLQYGLDAVGFIDCVSR